MSVCTPRKQLSDTLKFNTDFKTDFMVTNVNVLYRDLNLRFTKYFHLTEIN